MPLTFSDLELQKLDSLEPAAVRQLLTRLSSQLSEADPTLDLKRGVFHDRLLYFSAVLETALRQNLERYLSARSLQQIEQDPTLAADGVVDEVLSNWGVTRKIGTKAVGYVTIELSVNRTVIIPAGAVFEANGLRYVSRDTYTSRSLAEQVVSSSDRLLTQLSNGNWSFTIEVEAADVGAAYMLNAGALIVPNRSVAGYVTSYATAAFSNGTDTETNSELLQRLRYGISAKTISNRTTMQAYVVTQDRFASVTNQSIVGYGDAEMLRDKHSIVPVAYGGRVDWYVRTQQTLGRSSAAVVATCVERRDTSSVWQFSIPRTAFPGFYEIRRIRRAVDSQLNTGFEILQDSRGTDVTGVVPPPDIVNIVESAYTAYQTTTITFEDTVTPLGSVTVGNTADYVCDVIGLPMLGELQTEVSSSEYRHCAADILMRAPVPCFVEVSFVINKTATEPMPNIDGIKSAVAACINQTDFIGRLDGSRILETVHGFLKNATSVTQLELLGRIRRPDGTNEYLRATDSLLLPYRPAKLVSEKTVQFFTEADDIRVAVSTNVPVPA